jgi:hypothetical protein
MAESSLDFWGCFVLGCNASATLIERAERKNTSEDLATPTESGLHRFRPFPEVETVFDSGKFRKNSLP